MHRAIEIALFSEGTDRLLAELEANEHVVGLSVQRGASIKPPGATILTIAAARAIAGVVIQAAYRRSIIAGALVAMRLIEAAAVTGIALAVGRFDLVLDGLGRLAIDMGFIIMAGLVVFGLKQTFVHQRAPLR